MDKRDKALAAAFVALRAMAKSAPGPAQRKWATEAAAGCLWGLGIDKFEDIVAAPPEGATIDLTIATKALAHHG